MNWYYLENDQRHGPLSEENFAALVKQETIRQETFVWNDSMTDWKPYGEISKELENPNPAEPAKLSPANVGTITPQVAEASTDPNLACSRCGAEVSVTEMKMIGTMALCPKCQVGYDRQLRGEMAPMVFASPLTRGVVFILDWLLCNLVAGAFFYAVFWLATTYFENRQTTLGIILIGVVGVVLWTLNYFVGRIAKSGATPAMKLARIRIVKLDGDTVGVWRAFVRILVIGLVNSLTGGLGHLVAFFDKQKRSLHDMVCGTLVIKR